MSESTQRQAWKPYDGNEREMVEITFGPDRLKVARPTADAWRALEDVLNEHNYEIRAYDTHGYFPRNVKGTNVRSLHAYGLALDVNALSNPWKRTPGGDKVRFSAGATQRERAMDVKLGKADTDMTPELIADVLAIKTRSGKTLFEWGGNWHTIKDPMHFSIAVPPQDLASGIDWATVKGAGTPPLEMPAFDQGGGVQGAGLPPALWDLLMEVLRNRVPAAEPAAETGPILKLGDEGERVRKLQKALNELKYSTGGVDGIFGTLTRSAVASFQLDNGLSGTGVADADTWAALQSAPSRPLPPERTAITAEDLRRMGSRTVTNADRIRYVGMGSGLYGLLGLANSLLGAGAGGGTSGLLGSLLPGITNFFPGGAGGSTLGGIGGSALAIVLGMLAHQFGTNVVNARVRDQRDGEHLGRVGF